MKTDPVKDSIEYGGRCIQYSLHRTTRKNLRVVVNPDLSVVVTAPKRASTQKIKDAVFRKAPWITRTLDKIETYHPLPSPKQYISGETFVYLGRQYRLRVVNGTERTAKLSGRYLRISVDDHESREMVEKLVNLWYREHAKAIFERYLAKCTAVASRHGIPEPTLFMRKMRTRWGSCSTSGRITLNVTLIQVPVHCIEYVIMHELCHLQYHNHSPDFYRLLTRCQPDWRSRKNILDRFRLG